MSYRENLFMNVKLRISIVELIEKFNKSPDSISLVEQSVIKIIQKYYPKDRDKQIDLYISLLDISSDNDLGCHWERANIGSISDTSCACQIEVGILARAIVDAAIDMVEISKWRTDMYIRKEY